MVKGEYKKVLWDIFDILGFFEDEKQKALEGFKKKFANEMLNKLQNALSEDQRQWIATVIAKKEYDKSDPKFLDIHKTIELSFEKDEFDKISHNTFKKILVSYTDFMSSKVDPEKGEKLKKISEGF